jgi:hypothetical protein
MGQSIPKRRKIQINKVPIKKIMINNWAQIESNISEENRVELVARHRRGFIKGNQ